MDDEMAVASSVAAHLELTARASAVLEDMKVALAMGEFTELEYLRSCELANLCLALLTSEVPT